jgi:intein-encoded DNA endonuclease-like protein
MLSAEYIAGFFDGEGCVGISTRGRGKHPYLRVSVTNTNKEILLLMKAQFGGFLTQEKARGSRERARV